MGSVCRPAVAGRPCPTLGQDSSWLRPVVAAAAGTRLLNATIFLLAILVLGPQPLLAQGQSTDKYLIAVLPIQPVGISTIHALVLTDRLSEELLRTGRYTLIDRSQIDAILNEQALQQSGCTEQECAVQVGRILGVRRMVAGKITRIEGDLWLLSAILVDVETAETIRAESIKHSGTYEGLLDSGAAVLARKLAEPIGESRSTADRTNSSAPAAVTCPPWIDPV